ncbi:MAG: hypothetical protein EAZ12_08530 [Sphingobacteriia bacterium]|nr:MAG: hypothetical protein EAZ12_08530 [Sphingobacteriia bacterium]
MKMNKNLIVALVLMILASALYRIIPGRSLGFAPQMAIAIFAGSLLSNNKKIAFLLPLISMLISDGLYQLLYLNGMSTIPGFYHGQWINYLLFISLTCFGFFVKTNNILSIAAASLAAPTAFFVVSNFMVWIGGGGLHRPKTMEGLMQCFADGIPFYQGSVMATAIFAAIFFGTYSLFTNASSNKVVA